MSSDDNLKAAMAELAKRQGELERFTIQQQIENHKLLTQMALRQARLEERFAESDARWLQLQRRTERRYRRSEKRYGELMRVLENLPEAVRQKIGFGPKP